MICPVCGKDALIVEFNNIELDYCPECSGVWFDAGELELLLEAAGFGSNERFMEDVRKSPEVKTAEKKHRCPICLHKMKKAYIDAEKMIMTDVCHDGHGIWFDGGEVHSLVQSLAKKAPGQAESGKLLGFIGEIFKYEAKK